MRQLVQVEERPIRPAVKPGSPAGAADEGGLTSGGCGDQLVIGKVCARGSDVRRLLGYLFREGLAREHGLSAAHEDAHLIAA